MAYDVLIDWKEGAIEENPIFATGPTSPKSQGTH